MVTRKTSLFGFRAFPVVGFLLYIACNPQADPPVESQSAALRQAADATQRHLAAHAQQLGVDRPEDLKVHEMVQDPDVPLIHTRVRQHLDGIPVFGGDAIVHVAADGTVKHVTNGLVARPKPRNRARIDANEAIRRAKGAQPCPTCLTAEPRAALHVLRHKDNDYMAFKVDLAIHDGTERTSEPVVFVDAEDGSVIWQYDNLQTARGNALYKGPVIVETYAKSPSLFYLENLPRKAATFDYRNGATTRYPISDADNIWNDSTQAVAIQAHWATDAVLYYYQLWHGRIGLDGKGGPGTTTSQDGVTSLLTSGVHYGTNYGNAYWSSWDHTIRYGDGDGVRHSPYPALDIVAHEMTHGVTEFTANLVYMGESGALNEGTSDVMGALVTAAALGGSAGSAIWMYGEDNYTPAIPGDAERYFDDPHKADELLFTADDQPDHYSERYTGSYDNGGVHINSGIVNKAFYLMAEGGTHHLAPTQVIDSLYASSGSNPRALGTDKAGKIWYKALTSYWTQSTTLAQAAQGLVDAATSLYGPASEEVRTVKTAWSMVGVLNPVALPPDTVRPSVRWVVPTSLATVSGSVKLRVEATDNVGVAYVEYYVDSNFMGRASVAPYEFPWSTSPQMNGTHILTVYAYDLAGNTDSAGIQVTVATCAVSCGTYACGGTACKTSCASNADCAAPNICHGGTCSAAIPACGAGANEPIDGVTMDSSCRGYATEGSYKGFWYIDSDWQNGGTSYVCPSSPAGLAPGSVCVNGTTRMSPKPTPNYTNWGVDVGWNINQLSGNCLGPAPAQNPSDLTGKTVRLLFNSAPYNGLLFLDTGYNNRWDDPCVSISGQSWVVAPVSSFRNKCWAPTQSTPITVDQARSVTGIYVRIPSSTHFDIPFNYCINSVNIDDKVMPTVLPGQRCYTNASCGEDEECSDLGLCRQYFADGFPVKNAPIVSMTMDRTCTMYAKNDASYPLHGFWYARHDWSDDGGSVIDTGSLSGFPMGTVCAAGNVAQAVGKTENDLVTPKYNYWGVELGWNLNQDVTANCVPPIARGGVDVTGKTVRTTFDSPMPSDAFLFLEVKDTTTLSHKDALYANPCVDISGLDVVTVRPEVFKYNCWDPANASPVTAADLTGVKSIFVRLRASTKRSQQYSFCVSTVELRESATVYDEAWYNGHAFKLAQGCYDTPSLAYPNDAISSVFLQQGVGAQESLSVQLFKEFGFGGASLTINGSAASLDPSWDNTASSVCVYANKSAPCGLLRPGESIFSGTSVYSCDYITRLTQSDGRLSGEGKGFLWGLYGGFVLTMQDDGDLVLYDANHQRIRSSGTAGHTGAYLAVETHDLGVGSFVVKQGTSVLFDVRSW